MDHSATRAAARFLREHLAETVSVSDAADHVGYSPAHLSRSFARDAGLSPGRFLSMVRFATAKAMLLEESLDVMDVCTAVGFTSLPTFTRRFSASVGVAPGRFRALAETVAAAEQRPFALPGGNDEQITVQWDLPMSGLRRPPLVWVGWYPSPAAIGLPMAGVLVTGTERATLPLSPGAPWLLAFAVDPHAEVDQHLSPRAPLVAAHRAPILRGSPSPMTLTFASAGPDEAPLLSALPALRPGVLRRIG